MIITVTRLEPTQPWGRPSFCAEVNGRRIITSRHDGVPYEDDVIVAARLLVERMIPSAVDIHRMPARIVEAGHLGDWYRVQVDAPLLAH